MCVWYVHVVLCSLCSTLISCLPREGPRVNHSFFACGWSVRGAMADVQQPCYPLEKIQKNYGKSPSRSLLGKSTISMARISIAFCLFTRPGIWRFHPKHRPFFSSEWKPWGLGSVEVVSLGDFCLEHHPTKLRILLNLPTWRCELWTSTVVI
jgi:hypothetical protein